MESNREAEGICQRLFNFLVDVFLSGGLKIVTLGSTIGDTAERVQRSPDNEGMRKVKIEYSQTNGLARKDETLVHEKGFDDDSIHQTTTVPVRQWTTFELSKTDGINSDASMKVTSILKTAKNASHADSTGAKSEERGKKKVVSIQDAQEREMKSKKKEKNKEIMEETMPQRDVNMEGPRHTRPILWSLGNIDQLSDELIRRTREALRSSSGVEAGSS